MKVSDQRLELLTMEIMGRMDDFSRSEAQRLGGEFHAWGHVWDAGDDDRYRVFACAYNTGKKPTNDNEYTPLGVIDRETGRFLRQRVYHSNGLCLRDCCCEPLAADIDHYALAPNGRVETLN